MCGGELTHSVEHPTRKGERLFLLFYFTHNLKGQQGTIQITGCWIGRYFSKFLQCNVFTF